MPRKSRSPLLTLGSLLLASCTARTELAGATPLTPPAVVRSGADYMLAAPVPDLTSYELLQVDGDRPRVIDISRAATLLADVDVVFFGEVHRHVGVHHAQMALFRELYARHPAMSLSMEQFERDQQAVLDEYMSGKIGEVTMADRIELWANYGTSYRPLVEFAKDHKLPVIAANAPGMVVRCVGLEGPQFLTRMKPDQRPWAARALHLEDGPYKDKFMGFATGDAGHGGDPHAKPGEKRAPSDQAMRAFAAQVVRDDTMAESIADHLQKNPGRKVFHTTGYFHSESFLGTVERLKLRMPNLKIAVITPLENGDEAQPKVTSANLKSGTMLLVVRPLPDPYVTEEEARAAIKKQMSQRQDNKCEL
ncbi:MAG: ChaN family lipoprotein [Proteobacteria bacterium]|nr:ChaN family lipoprotein [Pseudomonadota bacterium]